MVNVLEDSVSTPRGMALKVIGVQGPRLPGSENDVTQDFVLVNSTTFLNAGPKAFLGGLTMLAATTGSLLRHSAQSPRCDHRPAFCHVGVIEQACCGPILNAPGNLQISCVRRVPECKA